MNVYQNTEEHMLDGCRVLDLTDEKGFLCGKILGDMGADVIKIESPCGDISRNVGPFYKDMVHPEKSLFWMAYNVNKRGITLSLDTADGREIFKKLAETADFVVESFDPGYMDGLGLGYSELEKVNPRVVVVSITPFGKEGPYSQFKVTDMVAWAMSGFMYLCGDRDRPPVRVSVPQAYLLGGLHGAAGAMMAHYYRERTGEGQEVDVSIQQACLVSQMNPVEMYDMVKVIMPRTGSTYISGRPEPLGPLAVRWVWPCKDGYVLLMLYGGSSAGMRKSSTELTAWAVSEGMALELKDYDWATHDAATITQQERDRIEKPIADFLLTKTKKELLEGAMARGLMLGSINNVKDIVESPQYSAREFWTRLSHPELNEDITYPGLPAKMSEASWSLRSRPPLIGEHNEDVYCNELGFSREKLSLLKSEGTI